MLVASILLVAAVVAAIAPLVLRRWALDRAEQDPVAAWFGFSLRLHALTLLALAAIPAAAVLGTGMREWLGGLMPEPFAVMCRLMLCLLPASMLRLIATLVAHDLSRRLRAVDTPRRVSIELSLIDAASLLVPFPLMLSAAAAITTWGPEVALILLLGGIVIWLALVVRSQRLHGLTLHSVTTGDLRDRVFALAQRAGVRLDQVFALPLSKWKHANAFATQGRRVMVTDYLLDHLDRDEVDAVMAHEIAHLAGKDPERQTWLLLVLTVACTVVAMSGAPPYVFAACMAPTLLLWLGYSRRCEYGADARGITFGTSPQASISGLAKLNRLGFIPLDYPLAVEWWLTHPSTRRRAHAMGRRANLPPEEVERLLAASVQPSAPPAAVARYQAPALEPGEKRFTTTFKNTTVARISMVFVLTAVTTSLAAIGLARALGVDGWMRLLLWPAAGVFVAATLLVVVDWLATAAYRRVARAAADRATAEAGTEGIAVGLAPHAEPRVYEGFSVWDLGLVTFADGRMDFRGEQTRFSLQREEITELRLSPGAPDWNPTARVVVSWQRADDTAGVFTLTPSDVPRLSRVKSEAWKLYSRLRQWRSPEVGSAPRPTSGASLGAPPLGEVTCKAPGADLTGRAFVSLAVLYLFVASILGFVCRFPACVGPVSGTLDAVIIAFIAHVMLLAPLMRAKGRAKSERPTDSKEQQAA